MYKLSCPVQNYDWGKLGSDSLVAQIFSKNGGSVNNTKTYAEYWMGTHINGPSFINLENSKISLGDFLKQNHNQEGLPFLFKVLSIKDALSIQAHPDKQFAEVLYSIDKAHYKDDNHKPELAIAISEKFKLFYGILNIEEAFEVSKTLFEAIKNNNSESKFFESLKNFVSNKNDSKNYYELICEIIKLNQEETKFIIESLINYLENKEDKIFHKNFDLVGFLFSKFQYDKGIIFSLYMNYYEMNKGDALFITPNIPHAYIEGDCIECMANSDNVIRLGLTPKFVDTENFLKVFYEYFYK
jgi:mannose-6-phosphate isomerase